MLAAESLYHLAQETNSLETAKEALSYLKVILDNQPTNKGARELRKQVEEWITEYTDTRAEIIPLFADRQHQTDETHSEKAASEAQPTTPRDNIISLLDNGVGDGIIPVHLLDHPEDWPLISSKAFYLATGFEISEEELNEFRTRTNVMRKEEAESDADETEDNIIPLHETEE